MHKEPVQYSQKNAYPSVTYPKLNKLVSYNTHCEILMSGIL